MFFHNKNILEHGRTRWWKHSSFIHWSHFFLYFKSLDWCSRTVDCYSSTIYNLKKCCCCYWLVVRRFVTYLFQMIYKKRSCDWLIDWYVWWSTYFKKLLVEVLWYWHHISGLNVMRLVFYIQTQSVAIFIILISDYDNILYSHNIVIIISIHVIVSNVYVMII